MFVLALASSTYPALGILRKNVCCSQAWARPHCVPLPSLVKVKTKDAQTLHCDWEAGTGGRQLPQHRPGCLRASTVGRGGSRGSLARCVLPFRRGALATGFGFFPLYSVHSFALISSVCTGRLCRLLWEQLSCPRRHRPCQVSIVNTTRTKRKQA